ncbi:MAG: hypothetical protein FD165_1984 [Gammaproteobacteria bacterium]|nr:MAG: hypothetical protein FD165_1984 [Gammaproteobacteria bacterium]
MDGRGRVLPGARTESGVGNSRRGIQPIRTIVHVNQRAGWVECNETHHVFLRGESLRRPRKE